MKKALPKKMQSLRENPETVKGSIKVLMKCSGKFLHGTRGKPGRSAHGDKHF